MIPEDVQDSPLIALPLGVSGRAPSLRETLDHQVAACLDAYRHARRDIAVLLRGHALASGSDEQVFAAGLSLDTARHLVAREHEFRDWADAIVRGNELVDRTFEAAVNAVVEGDLDGLERLLSAYPTLARVRSAYGHRATLLHYVAANGVEQTKQRSPANAPMIARALLDAGAEPDAQSASYGGSCTTTLELLVSSSHPAAAGVQADIVEELCRRGAKVEGIADDAAPLWTAITWGYTLAAERLVACGARVDNLIAAAAVETLERVKGYFGDDGRVSPIVNLRGARHFSHGRPFDLRCLLEYALIWAASHGRRDVVEFLLLKGPNLDVREPVYGNTALDAAKHRHPAAGRADGCPEIAALLEAARR